MTDYDNTNRWTLNKNTNRRNDKDSEYSGKINVDGKLYWLNGWVKESRNGKFISGNIKPAEPPRQDPISTGRPPHNDMDDDSIPF